MNDNQCVKRTDEYGHYFINENDIAFQGIHCWRININNCKYKGWIASGICKPKIPQNEFTDAPKEIIGFAFNDCWYAQGLSDDIHQIECIQKLQHFNIYQSYQVDILLNFNTKQVKFCVVGHKDKFQPTFYNINKYGNKWMPHINMAFISERSNRYDR